MLINNGVTNFVNMVKNNKNPQEVVMNMLQERANENPMFENLLGLVKTGNTKEIENIVRNVAKERGMDFDKEFNSFKQTFRL